MWKNLPKDLHFSRYQVSECGKIRNKHTGYVFQTLPQKTGYISVCVKNDKNETSACILHRLIAKTFIPNPNNLPIVDHINRIRHDNRVENLRWVTPRENNLNVTPHTRKCREVEQLDMDGNLIKRWSGIRKAEDTLGISHGKICMVCKGVRNMTGGFKWRYTEKKILEGEIWKKFHDIEISTFGRIKKKTGYIYYGGKAGGGYLHTPYIPNKKKYVHVLVAMMFLPNPNNYPVVNHIDENTSNNHVDNLEWCTVRHNTIHSIKTGSSKRCKEKLGKRIIQIDEKGVELNNFASMHEASRVTGISRSSISRLCYEKREEIRGFRFKFENQNDKHTSHLEIKNRVLVATQIETNNIIRFDKVTEAGKKLDMSDSSIYGALKKGIYTRKRYKFHFEDRVE